MPNIDLIRRLATLSAIVFSHDGLIKAGRDMSDIISLMDKVKDFSLPVEESKTTQADYKNLRADNPLHSVSGIDAERFVVPKTV